MLKEVNPLECALGGGTKIETLVIFFLFGKFTYLREFIQLKKKKKKDFFMSC